MIVDQDKLLRVFHLVAELEEAMCDYCKDGKQCPVPWQNVVDGIEQMTQVRITVTRVSVEAQTTNGRILRYSDNTAEILVQHGMAGDLDNFTIVKESTHPLIDRPEDMSSDGVATLQKLVRSSWFGTGNGEHDLDPVLQSEHLATIAAAAIVVPRRARLEYVEKYKSGEIAVAKIALQLNVPEHIVSLALDDGFNSACEKAMAPAKKAETA